MVGAGLAPAPGLWVRPLSVAAIRESHLRPGGRLVVELALWRWGGNKPRP